MIPKYPQMAYSAIITPDSDISMSPSFISFLVEHPIYTNPSIVSRTFFNFFWGWVLYDNTIFYCHTKGILLARRVLYDNTIIKGFV